MSTRAQYRDDILSIFYRHDPALADLPVSLTATDNGTTTTIVDTALGRGTTQTSRYDGRRVEIVETGHAALGEIAGVDNGGFDQTSTLTLSPAFGTLLSSGEAYRIYPQGLSPDLVYREINNVVRNTEAPYLWVPSLVPDSDFDADDLTNWPAVDAPSTRAFDTTADNLLFGERSLHIVSIDAEDGAESGEFYVTPDEQLLVSVIGRAANGSYDVILYDLDAAANIGDPRVVNELAFTEARFTETIPSGVVRVNVRLLSNAASDDFYISPTVTVQSLWERAYAAPSWLTEPERQIERGVLLRQGYASETDDAYAAATRQWEAYERPDIFRSDRWLNPAFVQFRGTTRGPVGFWCHRTYDELTADTSTTNLDRQYVAHKVAANLTRDSSNLEWQIIHERSVDIAREVAKARGYGARKTVWQESPRRAY